MKGCPKCGQRFVGEEEFCPQDGEALLPIEGDETDPLIGTTLEGRYTIQRKLGEGGMGVVYEAIHTVIGKRCAVKVLRSDIAGEASVSERFIQEARSAAAIGSEHIIEITDFGRTPYSSPYFVMEYLDGKSLQGVLTDNPKLELFRALHIVDQCCDALAQAHAAGVIHRDLKPDNLILIQKGKDPDFVKVLDFGIAKVASENRRLTQTGTIFGTPQYMAPEQAAGTAIDKRVDVYSLGIILYEILSGRVPFEADTFMGVLTKHLYEEPIPPRSLSPPVDIPVSVEAIILKAIAKNPDKRFQTMQEFQENIRAVMNGREPPCASNILRNSTLPPSPSEVVGEATGSPVLGKAAKGKRRFPLFLVVGGLAMAAACVAAVMLLSGGETGDNRAGTTPAGAEGEAVVVPVQPPPEPEAPASSIRLTSRLEGATLYKGTTAIGALPQEVPRPEGNQSPTVYRLEREGYEPLEITVFGDMPETFVAEMRPIAAALPEEVEKKAASANDVKVKKHNPEKRKKRRKKRKSDADGIPVRDLKQWED